VDDLVFGNEHFTDSALVWVDPLEEQAILDAECACNFSHLFR